MNYSEPLINQVTVFFESIGCGVILGVLYDVISFIRMIFGEKKAVYVFFDTIFFLISSIISFFFMVLYNSGQVRLNLMLGEFLGGMAFHFSFGTYVLKNLAVYIGAVRSLISFLTKPIIILMKHIAGLFKKFISKITLRFFTIKKSIGIF